jgi:hypothetical protein
MCCSCMILHEFHNSVYIQDTVRSLKRYRKESVIAVNIYDTARCRKVMRASTCKILHRGWFWIEIRHWVWYCTLEYNEDTAHSLILRHVSKILHIVWYCSEHLRYYTEVCIAWIKTIQFHLSAPLSISPLSEFHNKQHDIYHFCKPETMCSFSLLQHFALCNKADRLNIYFFLSMTWLWRKMIFIPPFTAEKKSKIKFQEWKYPNL